MIHPRLRAGLRQNTVKEMNREYLWDKTGEDPDIESLENALAAFRYQESEPPSLPFVAIVPVVEKAPRWNFSFAFAFAAAAVVVVAVGVWFQFSTRNAENAGESAVKLVPQVSIEKPGHDAYDTTVGNKVDTIEKTEVTAAPAAASKRHRTRRVNRTYVAVRREKRPAVLTKEEKYAYGQLMLALSITGTKLRTVTNTINGTEE
jgi:hypothetical protein